MSLTAINNYQFCAQWVVDSAESKPVKVLDYGCGFGEIVRILRERQIDSFGCDVFYDASDYTKMEQDPLFNTAIRKMVDYSSP
jgi:SAM-dependent methyltransferase